MSPFRSFLLLAGVLFRITYSYVDFGSLTLPVEPIYHPTPRPNQLSGDYDLRYEILPSMITAVAPSVTIAANGTHQTIYSLHYHRYFSKTRQGKGVFDKRGVFASDPPIATCTPCGGGMVTYSPSGTTTSTLPCTTLTYHGVFDFPPQTTSAYCYDTNYSGVFQPSTSSTIGLPCCFTIPASCRMNSTMSTTTSTSFTASTGVFRPTITSTTSALSSTTTTSRFSLTTPSSTSGTSSWSQGAILNGESSSKSKSGTVNVISESTIIITTASTSISTLTPTTSMASSSLVSSRRYTSPSTSSPSNSTTNFSIIVISSTTITITSSGTIASTVGSGTSSSLSTLTVITGTVSSASSTSTSVELITTTVPNTIIGCGQASGSGIVAGTGTVYLGASPIVTSGTASGSASNVSGCGTIIATTGTFTGSAEITGCGFGSGIGTLTGTGTVWPAYGGGLISLVTSGTVSGNGNFSGCGTLTGSGTFIATAGSPAVITPSTTATPTSRLVRTVSVYLSYCPDAMGMNDMLRLASGSNVTSSRQNSAANTDSNITSFSSSLSSSSSTNSTLLTSNSTVVNPLCQTCPNSVGICCPPTVHCSKDDGKCPLYALENSGNTINGYLIAQVMNSSAPVAGRKKIRALEKKHNVGKGAGQGMTTTTATRFGGKDLVHLEIKVERRLQRHQEKKRVHKKQF